MQCSFPETINFLLNLQMTLKLIAVFLFQLGCVLPISSTLKLASIYIFIPYWFTRHYPFHFESAHYSYTIANTKDTQVIYRIHEIFIGPLNNFWLEHKTLKYIFYIFTCAFNIKQTTISDHNNNKKKIETHVIIKTGIWKSFCTLKAHEKWK